MPTNEDELDRILEALQSDGATDDLSHDWDADLAEAKAAIQAHINKQVREARIDELKKLPIVNFNVNPNGDGVVTERLIKDRLAALKERGSV